MRVAGSREPRRRGGGRAGLGRAAGAGARRRRRRSRPPIALRRPRRRGGARAPRSSSRSASPARTRSPGTSPPPRRPARRAGTCARRPPRVASATARRVSALGEPAAPRARERDDVVDVARRRSRTSSAARASRPSARAHGEPSTPGRDEHLALDRLELVDHVAARGRRTSASELAVGHPERVVEPVELDRARVRRRGDAPGCSITRSQAIRSPRVLASTTRSVWSSGWKITTCERPLPLRRIAGSRSVLDLLEPDRAAGLHAGVVGLLDQRVARVGDDGAPPGRLDAVEQVVLRAPEPQQGLEVHGAMFAGREVLRLSRRACARLPPA